MAPTLDSREVITRKKTRGRKKNATECIKRSSSPVPRDSSMASVKFNEVAVYFSEEEWRHLEPGQKELYSNVMRDIHTTLISLGYTIAHPDVLCRIKKDQEPYISSQEEDRKGTCFPSTSSSVLSPDILFRIKHEDQHTNSPGREVSGDLRDHSNFAPVKDEDEMTPRFEYPLEKPGVSVDEEMYNIGRKDLERKERAEHSNAVNQLVFNPKLSLWIKQVDESAECEHNSVEITCPCDGEGEMNKLKAEVDPIIDSDKPTIQKDVSEHFSNKENANEKKQASAQQKSSSVHKSDHATKGEESLLSIVLKRANAGSLYMPSSKYLNSYRSSEYSKGIPRSSGKETCSESKLPSHQTPNSNEIVKSITDQQNVHEMDKPYRCNVCEKNFKTIGVLNVHMRTHTGVRPYQCNECGKSFRDNWNLKVHQKIHTGETPYKCTTCDKGFIQYATYMKHQRIHTGEKPYVCCYCDKSFTNSSNLVRHHRTHTGEKPYICMECGKSFSYNTSLIQHKRLHRFETLENITKALEK
ncbi:uncharacterized protein LOC142497401 isoform X2 [Ascaphus truei]|uniref:uncharacterized protein LOC142497401 isoform X2 n=1 Tax=Ascaphus truei TaxID=8439 RepID=UPI003F597F62